MPLRSKQLFAASPEQPQCLLHSDSALGDNDPSSPSKQLIEQQGHVYPVAM